SVVAWLKWRCKLSGGAAAERVGIARQLEQLPKTGEAFARGDVGYQHVAMIARTADHLGAGAVRPSRPCCRQRRPTTPASSPVSQKTLSTGSTPKARWRRPTGRTSGAICTWASRWTG
ncbi:MAG: DUF222 domain-containing protein, partial [Chloroflexi bacterium]